MEICTSWSREEIIRAQKDDPNIPFVMHGSSRPETPARYEAENPENGELRFYGQLQTYLETLNCILHRRVDRGTPSERLVLVVPRIPSSGHMGINRCLERLQKRYYWPGIASEMQLWITEREICDRCKTPVLTKKAPMKSIEVGQPMELWAMDILGPLPMTTRGNQYILVMFDHFTK